MTSDGTEGRSKIKSKIKIKKKSKSKRKRKIETGKDAGDMGERYIARPCHPAKEC